MDLLNIEEAKQRLGVSESTLRRLWYDNKIEAETIDRRLYFHAQDIDQLALRRRRGDVPLQRLSNDLLKRLSNAEQEIASLRQEVADLRALIQEKPTRPYIYPEKRIEPTVVSESPTTMKEKRQHASKPVAAKNTLPDGYRSFTDFFREHGIAETTAGRGVQAASIEVKEGNWKTAAGKMMKKALDADGQTQFCQFFSTHQSYHQCEVADCPCHTL